MRSIIKKKNKLKNNDMLHIAWYTLEVLGTYIMFKMKAAEEVKKLDDYSTRN